ncbi:MAG: hypothetical protein H6R32_631 [Candidatus Aminicenantes bacterium]|nr:hypothetical protein [Candidatus Aminicenantes bacterium]
MLAGSLSRTASRAASSSAARVARKASPRRKTSDAAISSPAGDSTSSRTTVRARSGRSFLTWRTLPSWDLETTAMRQPEWASRNLRSPSSSTFTDMGTLTAPVESMPSSATIQSLRPSEIRAARSPCLSPRSRRPAAKRRTRVRMSANVVGSYFGPVFSQMRTLSGKAATLSSKSCGRVLSGMGGLLVWQDRPIVCRSGGESQSPTAGDAVRLKGYGMLRIGLSTPRELMNERRGSRRP